MLELRYVVEHLEEAKKSLGRRNPEAAAPLDAIAGLADERRRAIGEMEGRAARRNAANQEMAKLARTSPEFAEKRDSLRALSDEMKQFQAAVDTAEARISESLLTVPNFPDPSVPLGQSSDDNPVRRVWGEKPDFGSFAPKPHWDMGTSLGILDFERAAKLSGPRFTVLMGAGARLSRALIQFMLDLHTREHGYTEVSPPLLVKDSTMHGTGQLPKFEEDRFAPSRAIRSERTTSI